MSFGLTRTCVRRITTPRPQSNSNFLPATSTRIAEPNRSAFGKGVPVPTSVTRISSEPVAAEMLSNMHSERNRTIKGTKCPRFNDLTQRLHLAPVVVSLALHYSTAIQAGSECDRAPARAVECVYR